jgi:hypothetical protein
MGLKALTKGKYVLMKVPYALENVFKLCLVYNDVLIVRYICPLFPIVAL